MHMYTDCVLHHHRIIRHSFNYLRTQLTKVLGFANKVCELCYHNGHLLVVYNGFRLNVI